MHSKFNGLSFLQHFRCIKRRGNRRSAQCMFYHKWTSLWRFDAAKDLFFALMLYFSRSLARFFLIENLFEVLHIRLHSTRQHWIRYCTNLQSWYSRTNIINFIGFNGTYTLLLHTCSTQTPLLKNFPLNGFSLSFAFLFNEFMDARTSVSVQLHRFRSYSYSSVYRQEM